MLKVVLPFFLFIPALCLRFGTMSAGEIGSKNFADFIVAIGT
nr:hypothetical protein [uncultured Undibacterium sp.]